MGNVNKQITRCSIRDHVFIVVSKHCSIMRKFNIILCFAIFLKNTVHSLHPDSSAKEKYFLVETYDDTAQDEPDDYGFKQWGNNNIKNSKVSQINQATNIGAGSGANSGFKQWGNNNLAASTMEQFDQSNNVGYGSAAGGGFQQAGQNNLVGSFLNQKDQSKNYGVGAGIGGGFTQHGSNNLDAGSFLQQLDQSQNNISGRK